MNLRSFLEFQGVSPKDIEEAVRSARRVTNMASAASQVAAAMLVEASKKLENERARRIALSGAHLAMRLHEGAQGMLGDREVPARASPSENVKVDVQPNCARCGAPRCASVHHPSYPKPNRCEFQ